MSRSRRRHPFPWRRHGRRTAQCRCCKKFISRPSAICRWCGNDPVTFRGDRRQYDLAYGWED